MGLLHRILLCATTALAACTASSAETAEQEAAVDAVEPAGVIVEPSGFWSIESAPDSPLGPPLARGPDSELTYYAQLAGVSNAEADKRLKEQEAARPEFERLLAILRSKERGNFTDARMVHRPDWAFVFYFKRDPEATLAKYARHPHFRAARARYTTAELEALSKPWMDRFIAQRILGGGGTDATYGEVRLDLLVSEAEYREIAGRNGWGAVPDAVKLEYSEPPVGDAVAPNLAGKIRIFPQSDRSLGATNSAALGGRISLDDGCFVVVGHGGKRQLAYFAREVGLGIDPAGYLSLHTRTSQPRHLGRIGEMFTWAGPIHIDEKAPKVAELRAQCGSAPLTHVGVPESSAMFNARYNLPRTAPPPPRNPG